MKQNTTKFTPFSLIYGRQAILPIEVNNTQVEEQDSNLILSQRITQLKELYKNTFDEVHKNINRSQQKQKEIYNSTAQDSFKIGDQVLVHLTQLQNNISTKLQDK